MWWKCGCMEDMLEHLNLLSAMYVDGIKVHIGYAAGFYLLYTWTDKLACYMLQHLNLMSCLLVFMACFYVLISYPLNLLALLVLKLCWIFSVSDEHSEEVCVEDMRYMEDIECILAMLQHLNLIVPMSCFLYPVYLWK